MLHYFLICIHTMPSLVHFASLEHPASITVVIITLLRMENMHVGTINCEYSFSFSHIVALLLRRFLQMKDNKKIFN